MALEKQSRHREKVSNPNGDLGFPSTMGKWGLKK